ncbi:MAG: glycosyltransferase [Firmicutes bacterium]|nr:glycosyltransferase [Bacillota bacterium]
MNRQDLELILVSMEGPDAWSQVGGLGTRVSGLATVTAGQGIPTHLVFWGDPALPPREQQGALDCIRWGQAISRRWPSGVYDGEAERVRDWEDHLPGFLVDELIRPALAQGREVVLACEEWQTAGVAIATSDLLHRLGVRSRVTLLWNANNVYGFDRIDWPRLNFVAHLTTVSRFMKQRMWQEGVNPTVIPNGVGGEAFVPSDPEVVQRLRRAVGADLFLLKIGRFDPDKRWPMALEALAALRARGVQARLLLRGQGEGRESVRAVAERLGLSWERIAPPPGLLAEALAETRAPVVEVGQRLPEAELRALYRAADAVLAQSGFEPFGLVGLEVMAQGGVAVTGDTGEDYAIPFVNALVVDSDQPEELTELLEALGEDERLSARLREAGPPTAQRYRWETVAEGFWRRVAQFQRQAK